MFNFLKKKKWSTYWENETGKKDEQNISSNLIITHTMAIAL